METLSHALTPSLLNALAVLAGSLLLTGLTRGEAAAGNATEGEMSETAEQRDLFYADGEPKCRLVLPSGRGGRFGVRP